MLSLDQLAVIVSVVLGLGGALSGGVAWFAGIRVLKHQVVKLEEAVEKLAQAQDSGIAIRVAAIEKWIDDFGNADQVRAWGKVRETVPELVEEMRELRGRVVELEKQNARSRD